MGHRRISYLRLSACVALFFVLASAGSASEQSTSSAINIPGFGARITFHDTEAALSFFPRERNQSRFYTIKFSHLVEANESETTPFQQATFDQAVSYTAWETLQNDTNNLIVTMNMTTSVSLALNTKLPIRIRYFMYRNETAVQQGTESISVEEGSLKFTFEMDSWPFKDNKNFVFLHTSITSSDVVSYSAELRPTGQVRKLTIHPTQSHNDSLFIEFPVTGMIDQSNKHVGIKVLSGASDPLSENPGEYIDLVFSFPYFSSALSYDPDVGLEIFKGSKPLVPSPPGLPLALIITLVAIAVAVSIFGLILAVQSYRKWRDRQRYSRMI